MKLILDIFIKIIIVIIALLTNSIKNKFDSLDSQVTKNTIQIEVLKEQLKLYNK